MALYAYGEEGEIVHAADAEPRRPYTCLECAASVQLRRGRDRFPHFYHLRASKGCRLYSKSEDHLLLQLQLKALLPPGEVVIEHPFLDINRVADLYWEKKRIVFEIQCSSLSREEAESRIVDYKKAKCDLIWLLDDRLFNRRMVRPAEEFLRLQAAYYVSFERHLPQSLYYDQFDVHFASRRLKKGRPLSIDLRNIHRVPSIEWPHDLPSCLEERLTCQPPYYVRGDLIDRLLKSSLYPSYALAFARWREIEKVLTQAVTPPPRWRVFLRRHVLWPYEQALLRAIEHVSG